MKTTILIIVLFLTALTACKDENSIVGPANDQQSSASAWEPNWIEIPQSNLLQKKFLIEGTISKVDGVILGMVEQWKTPDGPHPKVQVRCKLKFRENSVDEDKHIIWLFRHTTGVSTFLPHMMFNRPAELSITLTGLPLVEGDDEIIKFYYFWTDENGVGQWDYISALHFRVDVKKGEISMLQAKLPHFSRYGFAR